LSLRHRRFCIRCRTAAGFAFVVAPPLPSSLSRRCLPRCAAAAFFVAPPWNGGMVEWRNGRMAEWQNGGMAEWRNGMAERNGGTEWRNGMAEWQNKMAGLQVTAEWRKGYILNLPDIFTVHAAAADDDDNDDTF
jgi:hypothetical protein